MLVHLVADYGTGDLAFSEAVQRLHAELPDPQVLPLSVPPFDSLGAGFCIAQLALNPGPRGRVVYSNVAPRLDDEAPREDNQGERLLAARMSGGVLVVAVDSPYVFSFLRDEVGELREVRMPESDSQFRSRDVFPALVGALVRGDDDVLGDVVPVGSVDPVPTDVVLYTDGYGNLKTSRTTAPAADGTAVEILVGGASVEAVVSDGTFAVGTGQTSFAPGSSGWRNRSGVDLRFYEIFTRGGNAAEQLGRPPAGTPIQVRPLG